MPKPYANESESDFIERCITIVIEDGTADDGSQAFAVCQSIWDNTQKRIKATITKQQLIDDNKIVNK